MSQPEISAASVEWARAIGSEFVVTSHGVMRSASTATFATRARIRAILRPGCREEVQECVRVANRYGTCLYPVSTGKNWGYGSRVPPFDDAVLLDLGRMNRIDNYREDLAHVSVEPGVTQRQLFEFLRARRSRLWMDATGASPECSIIGNTMERGFGHTPYGDHFASACGLEVVLPTGECITTGFGSLRDAKASSVYRWGVGPVLDGLFTQSNLGIVTRMTIWLMPAPEYVQAFFLQCEADQDLAEVIDALRELRLNGTLRSSVHIGNDYKVLSSLTQYPWQQTGGRTPLLPDRIRGIRNQMRFGRWNASGGLYGTKAQVREARRLLKSALRGTVTRVQFLDDRMLALAERFSRPFRWATGLEFSRVKEIVEPVFGLIQGIPTDKTLASCYWRKREAIPERPDPDRDGCGLLWCAPVAPAHGRSVQSMTTLAEKILLAHGFEPMISLTLTADRAVTCVVSISYDRDLDGEDDRAMRCYRELFDRMAQAGFYSYRLGIQQPRLFDPRSEYGRLLTNLKQALDPQQILAPGRYLPTPQTATQADADIGGASQLRQEPVEFPPEAAPLHLQSRDLVLDLHDPSPAIYWTDYLSTTGIGWGAFALAVHYPLASPGMIAAAVVATLLLYRGLLFVHEISHLRRSRLRGLQTTWNLLSGFPLLFPTFVYCGVHQDHHRISLYGTDRDPEYLPFARSRVMTSLFMIESFFIPLALALRFLVLAPLGLVWPRLHRWLAVHASSLVMNLRYRRDLSGGLENKMRRSELIMLGIWGAALLAAWYEILPWRAFAVWLMVLSVISFVNAVRTLAAHDYESDGRPMGRTEQLLDSIDHPSGCWAELWAPVGLRYHALHHYYPGIPYHNLGKAYRRLARHLPPASEYRRSANPSLMRSIRELFQKGARQDVDPALGHGPSKRVAG